MDYQLNNREYDGLTAGKFLKAIIMKDTEYGKIFKGKIFPSIATVNTTFPYLVYERTAMTPYYCKDGCYQDEVMLDIAVHDDDYERCLSLLCGLRDLLECKSFPQYNVDNIEIMGASEDISDNGFEQNITLKIIFK